jgi:hypothetical protein
MFLLIFWLLLLQDLPDLSHPSARNSSDVVGSDGGRSASGHNNGVSMVWAKVFGALFCFVEMMN